MLKYTKHPAFLLLKFPFFISNACYFISWYLYPCADLAKQCYAVRKVALFEWNSL